MDFFSRKSKTRQEGKTAELQTEQKPKTEIKPVPKHVAEARKRIHGPRESSTQTPIVSRFLNRPSSNRGDDGGFGQLNSPFKPGIQRSMSSHTGKAGKVREAEESFMSAKAMGKRPATSDYFYTPQYSSDSGYESGDPISALHSRAPSERELYATRSNNGQLLPELRLGDDPPTALATEFICRTSSNEAVHGGTAQDLSADPRSIRSARLYKSTKSNLSVNKKTRFQEKSEPMPTDHMEQIRKNSDQTESAVSPVESPREAENVQPDHFHNLPKRSESQASQQSPIEPATAEPFSALQHSSSMRRGSLPPLHILDGFKVNKKGKILDEEGEQIGHLVEGDLLDCVRQKANAQGEVLDEYGRVVGRVQTLPPPPSPTATPSMHQSRPSADSYKLIMQTSSVQAAQPVHDPAERPNAAAETETVNPSRPTTRPLPVPHANQAGTAPRGRTPSREQVPQIAHPPQPEHPTLATNGVYTQETAEKAEPDTTEDSSSDDDAQQRPKTSSRDFAATATSAAPAPTIPPPATPLAESPNRVVRNASERSLSDLSKSYARPAMSSVPEYNIPEEVVPATPSLFAYKGEIPTMDGLAQQSACMKSKSPNGPVAPTSAYAMPGPSNYMKIAASQAGTTGRGSMRPMFVSSMRRSSGSVQFSSASSMRQPTHPALRKTAYSYDTSPNFSDSSTDPSISDDGRMPPYVFGGRSRAGSIGTTASVARPRTYFTHAGRVTVEPSPECAEKPVEKPASATAVPEPAAKSTEKKKSRIRLGFGRKAKAAA